MRFEDFLSEMPIRVNNLNVSPDAKSFHADDKALLNSEKAIAKIKRIWKSSVADVDLYTLDVGLAPDHALSVALDGGGRPEDHDAETLSGIEKHGVEFDPEAISVILTNNDGGGRLPLTGWIIAHRLYHCFQSARESIYHTANSEHLGPNLVLIAAKISEQLSGIMFDLENYSADYVPRDLRAALMGSTKACRDNNLTSYYELIPECFAQYMLRGKVSLRDLPSKPFIVDGQRFIPNEANYKYCNKLVRGFERFLNDNFHDLIEAAKGRVVAI